MWKGAGAARAAVPRRVALSHRVVLSAGETSRASQSADRVTSRLVVCLTGVARLRERPQEGSGDQRCCCWQLGKSAAARASSARALQGPSVSHTCDGDWCQLLSRTACRIAGRGSVGGRFARQNFPPRGEIFLVSLPLSPLRWVGRDMRRPRAIRPAWPSCACTCGDQNRAEHDRVSASSSGTRSNAAGQQVGTEGRGRMVGPQSVAPPGRLLPGPQSRRLVSGCGPGDARRLSDNRARADEGAPGATATLKREDPALHGHHGD